MKKKGFTLVELLAVIAILAILVVLAFPNIIDMFNTSKKNSFAVEVKELFKTAEQAWMHDNMENTEEIIYSNVNNGHCGKILSLSGRTILEYYIKINKAGKIVQFYATDGTYQYSYTGNGLKIDEINNIEATTNLNALKKLEQLCGINGNDDNNDIDDTVVVSDETPGVLVGEGTYENPYKIQSMEDLVAFEQSVNAKKYKNKTYTTKIIDNAYVYFGFYFTLETDLDFKSKNSYVNYQDTSLGDINKDGKVEGIMQEVNSGNGLPMIALNSDTTVWIAFDGKNHTIKNYNHKIVETDSSKKVETSFFGYTGDLFYVANINFENVNIDIDAAGDANISTLINRIGYLKSNNIRNINVSGNIKAKCGETCNVGGIFVEIGAYGSTSNLVTNITSNINIDVTAKNANVGGINAKVLNESYVPTDCSYKGNINVTANNTAHVAGIAGNSEKLIGVNLSVNGNINVKANSAYVYGLAEARTGEKRNNISQNGSIHNSFYKGNINVETSVSSNVGGLSSTKIMNSYFIGNIKQIVNKRNNNTNSGLLSVNGPVYNSYSVGNYNYIETSAPTDSNKTVYISLTTGKGNVTNSFTRGKITSSQVSSNNIFFGYLSTKSTSYNPKITNSYYAIDSTYSGIPTINNLGSETTINNLKRFLWLTNTLQIGDAWQLTNNYYPQVKYCKYNTNSFECSPKEELVRDQELLLIEN